MSNAIRPAFEFDFDALALTPRTVPMKLRRPLTGAAQAHLGLVAGEAGEVRGLLQPAVSPGEDTSRRS